MDVQTGWGAAGEFRWSAPTTAAFSPSGAAADLSSAAYHYHGHDFGRRSYFYHGHEYDRFYRGYGYRGLYLNVYAPGFYFAPAFTVGHITRGRCRSLSDGDGAGNPWYGYYGYYFQPYPVYPSAAFWLTDYIISQDLQAAYAANQEAGEADGTLLPRAGSRCLPPR